MAVKLNLAEDLKDFSKATKDKKYERISYSTWTLLKHLSDLPDSRAGFVGNYIYYKKEAGDALQRLTLCEEDSGFIHFLRDKYYFTSAYDTNTATTALNSSNVATITTATNTYAYGTIAVPLGDYTITASVKKEKENNKMFGVNFDFGSCSGDNIRMSMYGLAVKNTNGEWVSYNNGGIINVDAFNFDGSKFLFKMPVSLDQVAVGDVVIHNRVPMFVEEVTNARNSLLVTDPRSGERKEIVPTQSPFGFNFITKVVSLFAATQSLPSAEQPFGNMLPFMLCGDEDPTAAMAMMMMMNGNQKMDMTNPMMIYMLMKDSNNENMLPLLMMMNMNAGK